MVLIKVTPVFYAMENSGKIKKKKKKLEWMLKILGGSSFKTLVYN